MTVLEADISLDTHPESPAPLQVVLQKNAGSDDDLNRWSWFVRKKKKKRREKGGRAADRISTGGPSL